MQYEKMLSATIRIPGKQSILKKIFSLEEKVFTNKRASYDIELVKQELIFNIKANDSTALRSVLNTITKIITVYEKTEQLIKNEK